MLAHLPPGLALIVNAYAVGALTMLLAVALIDDLLARRRRDGPSHQAFSPAANRRS